MTDASYSTSNAGRHAEGEQDRDNVALALDLRVQLLEALVGLDTPQGRRILLEDGHKDGRHRGTAAAAAAATLPSSPARGSVARRAHHVLERVYEAIEAPGYDGIRRFLERCELGEVFVDGAWVDRRAADLPCRGKPMSCLLAFLT